MKILILILGLIISIFTTSLLLQIFWNDVAIEMFGMQHLSFIHAIEINIICRLLFQTFEFDAKIE
jgi:hypothetical protein